MIRIFTVAVLVGTAWFSVQSMAETGDLLNPDPNRFENTPDEIDISRSGFIDGAGIRFEFDLRFLSDTLSTGGTLLAIEFETEAGDFKSVTFDDVGGAGPTGTITSSADGVIQSLGTYPKDVVERVVIDLKHDRWIISLGDTELLEQAFPFNDDRFTLTFRLGNAGAHPNDGTGIVELERIALIGDDWISMDGTGTLIDPEPADRSRGSGASIGIAVIGGGTTLLPSGGFIDVRGIVGVAPDPIPDLLIGTSASDLIGDGIRNRAGKRQTVVIRKRPARSVRFFVELQNDGVRPGRLRVRGFGLSSRYKVTYLNRLQDSVGNVTARVREGRFLTRRLDPGEVERFRVVVTPSLRNRRLLRRMNWQPDTLTIRANSTVDPARVDVVKAVIKVEK